MHHLRSNSANETMSGQSTNLKASGQERIGRGDVLAAGRERLFKKPGVSLKHIVGAPLYFKTRMERKKRLQEILLVQVSAGVEGPGARRLPGEEDVVEVNPDPGLQGGQDLEDLQVDVEARAGGVARVNNQNIAGF